MGLEVGLLVAFKVSGMNSPTLLWKNPRLKAGVLVAWRVPAELRATFTTGNIAIQPFNVARIEISQSIPIGR